MAAHLVCPLDARSLAAALHVFLSIRSVFPPLTFNKNDLQMLIFEYVCFFYGLLLFETGSYDVALSGWNSLDQAWLKLKRSNYSVS